MNDLITRILSYAGKKRSEVNNPCITANEAIELANHIKKLEHTNQILAESHYRLRHELESITQEREQQISDLYEHIRHGDEDHQSWLKDEIDKFFSMNISNSNKKRIEWLSFSGARVGWDSEGERCRVFIDRNDDLGFVPASGYGVWFNSYEEAIDAAMVSK